MADRFDIVSITDAVWLDAAHSAANCTVQFAGFAQPLPYTARATDTAPSGKAVWAKLNDGSVPVAEYQGT